MHRPDPRSLALSAGLSTSPSLSRSLCFHFVAQLQSGEFNVLKVFIHDMTLLVGEEGGD